MAVCKVDPVSCFCTIGQDLFSSLLLTFTHGDCLKWNAFFVSESLQLIGWIHARTKYNDQRLFFTRLLNYIFELYGNTFNEVFLHIVLNVVADRIVDSVLSEASQNDHLFEFAFAFGVPFSW